MYVDGDTIVKVAAIITAVGVLFGLIFAIYRWVLKQNRQSREIKELKTEQCLIVYGLLACLKGLKEQGCNGPVTEAINKIEKYINQTAHSTDREED